MNDCLCPECRQKDLARIVSRSQGIGEVDLEERDLADASTRLKYRWLRHGNASARAVMRDFEQSELRKEFFK